MADYEQGDEGDNPVVSVPNEPAGQGPKADYDVGYKRPPRHTRFKPGQSGNPKGRPKGLPNHGTTVSRVMSEKVSVREGDRTRTMTKLEAMVQAHASKAMKGDARSASIVIGLLTRMGLLGDQQDEVLAALPEDDAIIQDYLRRNGHLNRKTANEEEQ